MPKEEVKKRYDHVLISIKNEIIINALIKNTHASTPEECTYVFVRVTHDAFNNTFNPK